MKNKEFLELLRSIGACKDSTEWVKKTGYSFKEAYQNCHRGDWLLHIFAKTSITNETNERTLFLAKGHCANTIRSKMTDKRSLDGVDAAIAYGQGKISKEELKKAADDAYAAAAAAYVAPDTASYFETYNAAYIASFASYASAYTYADVSDIVANRTNQHLLADICRKYLPFEIWEI